MRSKVISLALLFLVLIGTGPANAQSTKFGKGLGNFGIKTQDRQGPVASSVEASATTVAPGDVVVFAVILDHRPQWHSHTHAPRLPQSWIKTGFIAIPTTISLTVANEDAEKVTIGSVQWPEEHTVRIDLTGSGTPEPYSVYEGKAIAYVPVWIARDATGSVDLTVNYGYQACNATTCDPPVSESKTLVLTIDPAVVADAKVFDTGVFAGFDKAVLDAGPQAAVQSQDASGAEGGQAGSSGVAGPKFLGFIQMPSSGGLASILMLSLFGMIGGFVLNLTPCVLPVIPIKVLTLSQHAGTPGRTLYLGTWMALGVIAFWLGIGLPVAFLTSVTDPSRLFGIWWVTLGIGLIIAVMGVGIMGAFNISLPQKIYFINPKADSAKGSFVFGIMTAVLGLPCFGFVAGALLAGAATLPPVVILVIFGSLGVGMALPYFVMAFNPKLVEKIPRTGPASELVKQVMGLLLLSASMYFIGAGIGAVLKNDPVKAAALPTWVKAWHWWAVGLFAVAAGGWLIIRTIQITPKTTRRLTFSIIGLGMIALSALIVENRTRQILDDIWVPYTQAGYDQAIEDGNVVVLDFTADWCINCQVLKATVLDKNPVKTALQGGGVVPMVVDLTSMKAPGWKKVAELGQTGIPLLVIDGPKAPQPWLGNAYTARTVMDAIDRARGKAGSEALSKTVASKETPKAKDLQQSQ